MERHDFHAFGQVVAVAIETGARDGIKAALLAVKAEEQDRAGRIEVAARELLTSYRAGRSHLIPIGFHALARALKANEADE